MGAGVIRVGGHDGVVEWLRRDQVVAGLAQEISKDLGAARAIALLQQAGVPRRAFSARCTAKYIARGGALTPLPAAAVATAVLAELQAEVDAAALELVPA